MFTKKAILFTVVILECFVLGVKNPPKKKRNMLAGLQKMFDADRIIPSKSIVPAMTNITEDGKLFDQAEACLSTLSMKYVNHNSYQSNEQMLQMFKNFHSMRRGHTIKVNTKAIEEFNSQDDDMKVDVCKLYLNDSLFQLNDLRYDDTAAAREIVFTEKTVDYKYHIKHHKSEIVLQCPIRFKEKKGYLYFSTTEQKYSYQKNDDRVFGLDEDVFYYVYTENTYPPSSKISILMRTKLQNDWNIMSAKVRTVRYLMKLWYLIAGKRG